ncbi:MAG: stress response translation initiation inhibitor YciH [Elusimicrobia bacterium]|nr:stress response translation initiation inhibitor YciH [Elusimicrobiota bacterium]
MTAPGDRVVYSTDPSFCPACGRAPCGCKPRQAEPVRISFQRNAKGSGMTVVDRLQMHPAGKEELLRGFKKRLGTGGAVKFGVLELQGDHREFVEAELKAKGYKVKRIGG